MFSQQLEMMRLSLLRQFLQNLLAVSFVLGFDQNFDVGHVGDQGTSAPGTAQIQHRGALAPQKIENVSQLAGLILDADGDRLRAALIAKLRSTTRSRVRL